MRTQFILSFLFFAVLGTVLSLAANFPPVFGLGLSFAAFLPAPKGVFGNNIMPGYSENEAEKALLSKIDDKIKKSVTDFQLGLINEKGLEMRLQPLNDQLSELKQKGVEIESIKTAFNELSANVQSAIETQKAQDVADFKSELKKALIEKAKELQKKNTAPEQIINKEVGTMTFTASVTGTIPQADRDPGINDLNKRIFTIRALSSTGTTTKNVVEYTYKAAKEGSAAMTAEGDTKSQVDWEYKVDSANVKKITAFIKISKEMLDDIEGIMADINNELMYEIDYLEESQLISGTGLTVYINGIEKYAQPLDNASLAGTIPSGMANKWDALGAAIKQIAIETEGRSQANAILMNPADVFSMVHGSRTTTEEYNAPMAVVSPDGTRIYGLPVIETNSITSGEFLVGDFRKFYIKDREAMSIQMGYDGNDWTKNLVTIIAEKRLVSYVKKNDEAAFVTDTFADAITFLEAAS